MVEIVCGTIPESLNRHCRRHHYSSDFDFSFSLLCSQIQVWAWSATFATIKRSSLPNESADFHSSLSR